MGRKQVKLSSVKKAGYAITGILVAAVVVFTFVPISVSVSADTINEQVKKKLPIYKTKEFSIPFAGAFSVVAAIDKNNVAFADGAVSTQTEGEILHEGKGVRFTAKTSGSAIEYDRDRYSFYYRPKNVDIALNQEDMDKILDPIEEKARELSKPKEEKNLFGRLKDKFKKEETTTVEVGSGIKINIANSVVEKYKEKAKTKAREVLDSGIREKMEAKFKDIVEENVRNTLNSRPVYTLKDTGHDEKAKLFLRNVLIDSDKLVIEFSLANIMEMILKGIFMIFISFGLIFAMSSGVSRGGGRMTISGLEIVADGFDMLAA